MCDSSGLPYIIGASVTFGGWRDGDVLGSEYRRRISAQGAISLTEVR